MVIIVSYLIEEGPNIFNEHAHLRGLFAGPII